MTKRDQYLEKVATTLIQQMKEGVAPWQKPWVPGTSTPINTITKRPYRGGNRFWLAAQGYTDPRWLTYKQAQSLGAQVRKGEKSTMIEYWKFQERRKDENGEMKTYKLGRPYRFTALVFNAQQVDGLPEFEAPKLTSEAERLQDVETFVDRLGADIRHEAGDRAYYNVTGDFIVMPELGQFASNLGYYQTMLHELAHWTGAEHRMNRDDMLGGFGSEAYAREELRAEIAAYLLGDKLQIGNAPQTVAYTQSWLGALGNDYLAIYQAVNEAQRIVDYLEGFGEESQDSPQP